MRFTETKLKDVWIIEMERKEDHRGFFARSWCRKEFEAHGLRADIKQMNVGFSHKRSGVRGLHFQLPPHAEAKTVRCTMGALYDVAVDVRPGSPTYKQWVGVELTADNHGTLYIPFTSRRRFTRPILRAATVTTTRPLAFPGRCLRGRFHRTTWRGQNLTAEMPAADPAVGTSW